MSRQLSREDHHFYDLEMPGLNLKDHNERSLYFQRCTKVMSAFHRRVTIIIIYHNLF